MKPIITSVLDLDLYKLTMHQAVYHQYFNEKVVYEFKCRNKDVDLSHLYYEVQKQVALIHHNLTVKPDEIEYLESTGLFAKDYLKYLGGVIGPLGGKVIVNKNDGLHISVHGSWVDTILWETIILSIVNELYFRSKPFDRVLARQILNDKISALRNYPEIKIAEFGTRRRYSHLWQDEVIGFMASQCPTNLIGTSNVYFAKKHGLKPIGTMAHEWFMAHMGITPNFASAQKRALYVWQQEYAGKLGVALSDTFSSKAFFQDFNYQLATMYDGLRHDSGDPIVFGDAAIRHYESLNIDPKTKSIVFSDGLDIPAAIALWRYFHDKINVSFGIGTNLTNDVGHKALNIVMKLTQCNGIETVKISDNIGKAMGPLVYINEIKRIYDSEREGQQSLVVG